MIYFIHNNVSTALHNTTMECPKHSAAHGNEFIYNSQNKPDIICIQESWLKENIYYKLNNYSIIRKERKFTRGGGVCVLVKNNVTYKIKENEFVNNVEYNHIKIFINSK